VLKAISADKMIGPETNQAEMDGPLPSISAQGDTFAVTT
jgi:hypothetical protein